MCMSVHKCLCVCGVDLCTHVCACVRVHARLYACVCAPARQREEQLGYHPEEHGNVTTGVTWASHGM